MWEGPLLQWQQRLLERLERALGHELGEGDLQCVAWNTTDETLAVVTQPLLAELRALNLMSNVFRAADLRPPEPLHGADIVPGTMR